MRCPNCGLEVEKGTLFCPKCLEEIQWVPEYNTVETLWSKKKLARREFLEKSALLAKRRKSMRTRKLLKMMGAASAVLIVFGAVGWIYYSFHSFSYQYEKAEVKLKENSYEDAIEHVDRAIALNPKSEDALGLLSEILLEKGDIKGAAKNLEVSVARFPDSIPLYGQLLSLYEDLGAYGSIKRVLNDCTSKEVYEKYEYYICEEPTINLDSGTYTYEPQITIVAEGEDIYYTLDGSDPTFQSKTYSSAITIPEGKTTLKVQGVNARGVPSEIITRTYTVVLKVPDAPQVQPESGAFTEITDITVDVPEGCTAYYAFNEIPTEESTKYTSPIRMPEGAHTLNVILIGANGKISEVTSRSYQLTY